MTVLGRDFKARFASRFAGRLYPATLTKSTPGDYDPDDLAAGTNPTTVDYACEGAAFSYDVSYVDGEQIKMTDYRVMILLGSFKLNDETVDGIIPNPGDTITIAPPGQTVPSPATVGKIETLTNAAVTFQASGQVF